MTTLHQLIGSENNQWRCPNCKGAGVEIHEERTNTKRARELRHYQHEMSHYRRRLAWANSLLREISKAKLKDAFAIVALYERVKELTARLAECDADKFTFTTCDNTGRIEATESEAKK